MAPHTLWVRLEFGNRGTGEKVIARIPTLGLAALLAAGLVRVFTNDKKDGKANPKYWNLRGSTVRESWQSDKHFVILTKLDGKSNFLTADELGL